MAHCSLKGERISPPVICIPIYLYAQPIKQRNNCAFTFQSSQIFTNANYKNWFDCLQLTQK